MNRKFLNTVNLDGGVIIKKSGGGGNSGGGSSNDGETTLIGKFFGKNDVNFFDIDGSLLSSFSWEEIVEMDNFPVPPERDGFEVRWNCDIEKIDLKNKKQRYDIGAIYTPTDGASQFHIELYYPTLLSPSIKFNQNVANGVTVDWGDGTTNETSGVIGDVVLTHEYSSVGNYIIKLLPSESCTMSLGWSSTSLFFSPTYKPNQVNGSPSGNCGAYMPFLKKVFLGERVKLNSYAFYMCTLDKLSVGRATYYSKEYLFNNSNIPCIILDSGTLGSYQFANCKSYLILHGGTISYSNAYSAFNNAALLLSYVCPNSPNYSNVSYLPDSCNNLKELYMSPNNFASISSNFPGLSNTLQRWDFSYHSYVPTLSASKVIPQDCKIVVPDNLYEDWINSTNWSSLASKIIKASEFNG